MLQRIRKRLRNPEHCGFLAEKSCACRPQATLLFALFSASRCADPTGDRGHIDPYTIPQAYQFSRANPIAFVEKAYASIIS
jgi:hypothetical protein